MADSLDSLKALPAVSDALRVERVQKNLPIIAADAQWLRSLAAVLNSGDLAGAPRVVRGPGLDRLRAFRKVLARLGVGVDGGGAADLARGPRHHHIELARNDKLVRHT